MTFDINAHLKVAGIPQTADWLQKRTRAINQLSAAFRKRQGDQALTLASAIVAQLKRGFHPLPEELKAEVFAALRKPAPQYVPDKNADAELGLCAMLAATLAVTDAGPKDFPGVTALACAIASGAQFNGKSPPKLELLRREIVQRFGDILHARAEAVRKRTASPVSSLPAARSEEAPLDYVGRLVAPIQNSLNGLQTNASRDREELDLLWWRLNGVGSIVPGRYSGMSSGPAAVSAGFEVGSMLAFAVASDAHRAIAASVIPAPDAELTLAALMESLASDLGRLNTVWAAGTGKIDQYPTLFPLMFALRTAASDTCAASLAAARIDTSAVRTAEEWCARAVDEAALLARVGCRTTIPLPVRA